MPPKTIKLNKRDDIAVVIRQLKTLRDREVIFQLDKGSALLASSDNLKLIKKVGDAMGKTVRVTTDDELGKILARKAGVLFGESETKPAKFAVRVSGSGGKSRFSDIMGPHRAGVRISRKTIEPVEFPEIDREFRSEYSARKPSKFLKFFVFSLFVLVVGVFATAVFLPSTDVTIFARSEPITRDLEIAVDKNFTAANSGLLQVPVILVTKEVSQTKSFPATGIKLTGTKAKGIVTLYNFTANTLTLKAATTMLVVDGKKFLFTKDITGIKPNGAPNAGIEIIAEQPGDDHNLPANTKFQVVNQALGNANVYATSDKALTGGNSTSAKVLSQADVDKASEGLIADVIAQAEDDLSAEKGSRLRLLDSGVTKEILAKTANKNVGDVVESFDMTLIARISGMAFREDDVINIVTVKINEVLSTDKYLLPDGAKKYTAEFKTVDLANSKGVLALHFQTIAAYQVDATGLSKILAGKNESEIKEILLSKPEVDNVEVKFWPEWFVHKAPRFNGKIYIDIALAQE